MSEEPLFSVEVELQNLQDALEIDSAVIEDLVSFVLHLENHGGRIGICFVDDEQIAKLHGDFMDDPTATDVITFPLEEPLEGILDGEIVISTDTAIRQATERNCSVLREVYLYVVHGLLHLLGHDDLEAKQAEAMNQLQEAHLVSWGQSRGFIQE
ncbi:MAG: rRNA maturation RNase YbeY [Planctomycetota bacterium]